MQWNHTLTLLMKERNGLYIMKRTAIGLLYNQVSTKRFWNHRSKLLNKNPIVKAYHMVCYQRLLSKSQAWISNRSQISAPFDSPHGISGIFISSGAVIGTGCTIFQQVTIGSNTLMETSKSGSPIIGNNVYIGVGAKIIGRVRVGNNVRIGANCVVFQDIPDNSTVVSSKPRIIEHQEERNNLFIEYKPDLTASTPKRS